MCYSSDSKEFKDANVCVQLWFATSSSSPHGGHQVYTKYAPAGKISYVSNEPEALVVASTSGPAGPVAVTTGVSVPDNQVENNAAKEEAILRQLAEMGFSEGSASKELLKELNYDIVAVVEHLTLNAQTSDSPQLRANYKKGSEVYWWAFSSTTKELSTLQNPQFLGTSGVRTVFNIHVKRGVDIVRYTIFQGEANEAEVLIYPGTKLRVVDSMDMGGGLFMVHLEELEIPTELMK